MQVPLLRLQCGRYNTGQMDMEADEYRLQQLRLGSVNATILLALSLTAE